MTVKEYAKREGMSEPGVLYRIKTGKLKATKVNHPGSSGFRYIIGDNGHSLAQGQPDVFEALVAAFPDITLSKAIQIRGIVRG